MSRMGDAAHGVCDYFTGLMQRKKAEGGYVYILEMDRPINNFCDALRSTFWQTVSPPLNTQAVQSANEGRINVAAYLFVQAHEQGSKVAAINLMVMLTKNGYMTDELKPDGTVQFTPTDKFWGNDPSQHEDLNKSLAQILEIASTLRWKHPAANDDQPAPPT